MQRLLAPPFALLVACSGAASNPAPANDSGGDVAPMDDAADAFVDPNTPYEHAIIEARWVKLQNGPTVSAGKQDDLFFTDAMTGYLASGPSFSIFKTTDGGGSWNKSVTQKGTYFRSVAFLDAQHGFAGNFGAGLDPAISDATVLYETKTAGAMWTPVTNITGPAAGGICNFSVIDATHVVAVGRANGPSNVLSYDGAAWTSVDVSADMTMLVDAHFTTPLDGILVGMSQNNKCAAFHTVDGGKTLKSVFESKVGNGLCWKIQFPSSLVGYIAIQDTDRGPPSFAKTIDGGKSWAEKPLPLQGGAKVPFPAIGIGFMTDQLGWVSPEDPTLPTYMTIDGGETWNVDPTLKSPINRFRFVDKKTAYAVGGATWKLSVKF